MRALLVLGTVAAGLFMLWNISLMLWNMWLLLAAAVELVARKRRLGRLFETHRVAFDAMDEALRKGRR